MNWLVTPAYWWALLGSLAQIAVIAVMVAALVRVRASSGGHARGATLAFALYLVLFWAEPHPHVQAAMRGEGVPPAAALRTVAFVATLALLVQKLFRLR